MVDNTYTPEHIYQLMLTEAKRLYDAGTLTVEALECYMIQTKVNTYELYQYLLIGEFTSSEFSSCLTAMGNDQTTINESFVLKESFGRAEVHPPYVEQPDPVPESASTGNHDASFEDWNSGQCISSEPVPPAQSMSFVFRPSQDGVSYVPRLEHRGRVPGMHPSDVVHQRDEEEKIPVSMTEEEKQLYNQLDKSQVEVCAICYEPGILVHTRCMSLHLACYETPIMQERQKANPRKCLLCNGGHISNLIEPSSLDRRTASCYLNPVYCTKARAMELSRNLTSAEVSAGQRFIYDFGDDDEVEDSEGDEDVTLTRTEYLDALSNATSAGRRAGRRDAAHRLNQAIKDLQEMEKLFQIKERELVVREEEFETMSNQKSLEEQINHWEAVVSHPYPIDSKLSRLQCVKFLMQRMASIPYLPFEYSMIGWQQSHMGEPTPRDFLSGYLPNSVPGPHGEPLREYYGYSPLVTVQDIMQQSTLGKRERDETESEHDSDIEIETLLLKGSKRFKDDDDEHII